MTLRMMIRGWVGALVALMVLGAVPAWAQGVAEEFFVTREEVPEEVLSGLVGVATVRVGPGAPWVLQRFEPGLTGFRASGEVVLARTRALSGWSLEDEALRRYPVLERRGHFLRLVIDVRTGEEAWLREQPEDGPQASVRFHSLDAEGLGTSDLDLSRDLLHLWPAPPSGC